MDRLLLECGRASKALPGAAPGWHTARLEATLEKTETVFAEYLGDVQISHVLQNLVNTNPHVNSLKHIPNQRYIVSAEFDPIERHKLVRLVLTVAK